MLQDAPITTYRFQLHEHFTFEDAQKQLPYLQELGVTHIYLSPILAATSHSQHGYDVVDHSRINPELTSSGGDATAAFAAFVAEAKAREMMLIADIVPNHMSVAAPMSANPAWWDVLKHGQRSEYACWFDINWEHYLNHGKIALAVLGGPPDELLAKKEITLSADGTRIEYYSHQFPVAPGTLVEGDVAATLAGQHYVLVFWKEESKVLNYRRFFDIGSLAGLRVEDPKVFDATHKLMCGLVRDGTLAGLRVDHPDGLADPAGYANRLKEATDGAWVVMEKILAPDEDLPSSWPVSGTTGYDALNTVLALLAPPAAAAKTLTTFYASLVKNKAEEAAFEDVEWHSKYYHGPRVRPHRGSAPGGAGFGDGRWPRRAGRAYGADGRL
ncbi:glycoside hydrolase [Caulochytrium protostelioides]|uniref:Glycoside hydrolase n=1 Tax=Caulochytrium protostelioides TaxID=1555241 RepID=A0A4V1ITA4_9FUNG|nr:glycoside hydrolase [Caulochytrium protostelioides]